MPCLIFLMPILRIDLLKAQKERFIGNIIYEKYYVVYSVTKTTIRVISIVHQATNPKKLSKIK